MAKPRKPEDPQRTDVELEAVQDDPQPPEPSPAAAPLHGGRRPLVSLPVVYTDARGDELAAVIVRVNADDTINLHVFGAENGVSWFAHGADYDTRGRPHSWHWAV